MRPDIGGIDPFELVRPDDARRAPTLWVKEPVPETAVPRLPTPSRVQWFDKAWNYKPSYTLHGDETVYTGFDDSPFGLGAGRTKDTKLHEHFFRVDQYTLAGVTAFHRELARLEDGHLSPSADMQELLAKHPRIKLAELAHLQVSPSGSTLDAEDTEDEPFARAFRESDFYAHVLHSGGWAGREPEHTRGRAAEQPLSYNLALVLALYRTLHSECFEASLHSFPFPEYYRLRVGSSGLPQGYLRCLSAAESKPRFEAKSPQYGGPCKQHHTSRWIAVDVNEHAAAVFHEVPDSAQVRQERGWSYHVAPGEALLFSTPVFYVDASAAVDSAGRPLAAMRYELLAEATFSGVVGMYGNDEPFPVVWDPVADFRLKYNKGGGPQHFSFRWRGGGSTAVRAPVPTPVAPKPKPPAAPPRFAYGHEWVSKSTMRVPGGHLRVGDVLCLSGRGGAASLDLAIVDFGDLAGLRQSKGDYAWSRPPSDLLLRFHPSRPSGSVTLSEYRELQWKKEDRRLKYPFDDATSTSEWSYELRIHEFDVQVLCEGAHFCTYPLPAGRGPADVTQLAVHDCLHQSPMASYWVLTLNKASPAAPKEPRETEEERRWRGHYPRHAKYTAEEAEWESRLLELLSRIPPIDFPPTALAQTRRERILDGGSPPARDFDWYHGTWAMRHEWAACQIAEWNAEDKPGAVEGMMELLSECIIDALLVEQKLKLADAFCLAEGAQSVDDIVKYKLADDFIEALEPLRRIPRARLKEKLEEMGGLGKMSPSRGGGGRRYSQTVIDAGRDSRRRRPQSVNKQHGEVIVVKGRKYTLEELLAKGNAEIWAVLDEMQSRRVLKITEEESVQEEVAARQALGWDSHGLTVLKAIDFEGPCLILERAERSLRQRIDASAIDRATVPSYLKALCTALVHVHRARLVHMDIKPANIFQVLDERTGDPIWKLGDFDTCRRTGEPVGGFTSHYAAPELASAELDGRAIAADAKMDIFSAGLSVLECATGCPLIAKGTPKEEALTLLSSHHGGRPGEHATRVLEGMLADAMAPLDPALRSALKNMLEVNPRRRKDANAILHTGVLSGQVTTTVRRAANQEVLSTMATMKEEIISELGEAESRLAEQIEAGNQAILEQMVSLQASSLPQMLSVVKQQRLELTLVHEAREDDEDWSALPEDGGFARVKERYLREKAAEAAAETGKALEATSSKLGGADPALAEMLSALVSMQPQQQDHSAEVLAKLDALAYRMEAMGEQFGQLSYKMDAMDAKQAHAFNMLGVKLDQLLTNEHEQIFSHFILKPLPEKGRMGKVLAKMHPKYWLTKPMLLVPLYKDPYGRLLEAPVDNKYKGFKVSKPSTFVEKHPRMVQLGMLALKIGIKVAAAQLAVSIPAETLDLIGAKTDGLINEMLTMGVEAMKADLEDEDNMDEYMEQLDAVLASTFDEPNDAPDEALEAILDNDRFKRLSKLEYAAFKRWLDGAHPAWQAECGLVSEINPATGRAEYVPPGTLAG